MGKLSTGKTLKIHNLVLEKSSSFTNETLGTPSPKHILSACPSILIKDWRKIKENMMRYVFQILFILSKRVEQFN